MHASLGKQTYSNSTILLQSAIRYYLCRKALNTLRKKRVKRNHIVSEILSTEKVYVTNLQVLIGVSDNLYLPRVMNINQKNKRFI